LELFTGHRLIVRESLDELVERVIAYRRALARMDEVVIDVTSGEPA
jgi:uncharacterized protein YlzI (FlbEa/FlbD family)